MFLGFMPEKYDNADLKHEALLWKVSYMLIYFPKLHRGEKHPKHITVLIKYCETMGASHHSHGTSLCLAFL